MITAHTRIHTSQHILIHIPERTQLLTYILEIESQTQPDSLHVRFFQSPEDVEQTVLTLLILLPVVSQCVMFCMLRVVYYGMRMYGVLMDVKLVNGVNDLSAVSDANDGEC